MNRLDERIRISLSDRLDHATEDAPADSFHTLAVTTTAGGGAYPKAASAFYLVTRLMLLGVETEGSPGDATPLENFVAFNFGSGLPPVGTQVLCSRVDDRWAFRYDG